MADRHLNIIVTGEQSPSAESFAAYLREERDAFRPPSELPPNPAEIEMIERLQEVAPAVGELAGVRDVEGQTPLVRDFHFFPTQQALVQAVHESGVHRGPPPPHMQALSHPKLGILLVRDPDMRGQMRRAAHEMGHDTSATRVRVTERHATDRDTWRSAQITKGWLGVEWRNNPHSSHSVDEMLIDMGAVVLLQAAGEFPQPSYPGLVIVGTSFANRAPRRAGERPDGPVLDVIRGNLTGSTVGLDRLFGKYGTPESAARLLRIVQFDAGTQDRALLDQLADSLGVPEAREQFRRAADAWERGRAMGVRLADVRQVPEIMKRQRPRIVRRRAVHERTPEQNVEAALRLIAEARTLMQQGASKVASGGNGFAKNTAASTNPAVAGAKTSLKTAIAKLKDAYGTVGRAANSAQRFLASSKDG